MNPLIDVLLLDVDGVLLDYDGARRIRHLAEALRVPALRVSHALQEGGLDAAYDSGDVDTVGYLQRLSTALDAEVDAPTWVAARVVASRPCDAVIQRVLALPPTLRIGLLTNNGPMMTEVLAQLLPTLCVRARGHILCSAMLGGRKPDPAVYLRALDWVKAAPRRTLFIDDLFRNVRGARLAGLHAETADDGRSLGRVFKRYGLV
ncbi:HAD-IA family hydrolase [Stenotrophomonas sp. CFBP 13725]|uniref:HAD-IA family hydrolase n=1 Tax=Stenotrophomonas sp. CFBP 13725 TaxID=2775297 RepID=UPI00177F148C|nr:HAD-IA family hydrolase [Stenotrophomonas sp. CFBP 13725]MBD8636219.1 HAD-IA family hydrolase [Stenotrophomonas sp. CFBP 13725]